MALEAFHILRPFFDCVACLVVLSAIDCDEIASLAGVRDVVFFRVNFCELCCVSFVVSVPDVFICVPNFNACFTQIVRQNCHDVIPWSRLHILQYTYRRPVLCNVIYEGEERLPGFPIVIESLIPSVQLGEVDAGSACDEDIDIRRYGNFGPVGGGPVTRSQVSFGDSVRSGKSKVSERMSYASVFPMSSRISRKMIFG